MWVRCDLGDSYLPTKDIHRNVLDAFKLAEGLRDAVGAAWAIHPPHLKHARLASGWGRF